MSIRGIVLTNKSGDIYAIKNGHIDRSHYISLIEECKVNYTHGVNHGNVCVITDKETVDNILSRHSPAPYSGFKPFSALNVIVIGDIAESSKNTESLAHAEDLDEVVNYMTARCGEGNFDIVVASQELVADYVDELDVLIVSKQDNALSASVDGDDEVNVDTLIDGKTKTTTSQYARGNNKYTDIIYV